MKTPFIQRLAKRGRRLPPTRGHSRRDTRKIDRIDSQRPDMCRAEIVGWQYAHANQDSGTISFPLLDLAGAAWHCKAEAAECGTCWCGKFVTPAVVAEFPEFGRNGIIVEATNG